MSDKNRRFLLRERPSGRVDDDTFELVTEEIPEISDGEALIKTEWVSIDPTNRGWLNDERGYLPPVGIGDPIRAGGIGRVISSNNDDFPEGKLVRGFVNWQEYVVAPGDGSLSVINELPGVDSPSAYLGIMGMTGLTAWVGTTQIGDPQEGETFIVSAAAGAVGSVAGQLAQARGARVVGIAGGPEKCGIFTDKLGFDASVDYKAEDWREQMKAVTSDGIDVDFENVGGEIMEMIFGRMNKDGRVALCGLISGYNEDDPQPGPRTFGNILVNRVKIQGFIVLDHYHQAKEAGTEIAGLMGDGKLKELETVVEGFDELPSALNMLFDGDNVGKLVVKLTD